MITYAESQKEQPFNWFEAIDKIALDDEQSWLELNQRADQWVTCAVGNQCVRLLRGTSGVPLDYVLASLGLTFATLVFKIRCRAKYPTHKTESPRLAERAKEVLELIETRAEQLLNRPQATVYLALRSERSGKLVTLCYNFTDMRQLFHQTLDYLDFRYNREKRRPTDFASLPFHDALGHGELTLESSEVSFTEKPRRVKTRCT